MERLKQRIEQASHAIDTLDVLAGIRQPDDIERDAMIQRFEYSFEAWWKAAKLFLAQEEGIQVASPKAVVRASLGTGLLTEAQARQAMRMVDDRNLTSHTYNEALARQIAGRIPQHAALLRLWTQQLARRMAG